MTSCSNPEFLSLLSCDPNRAFAEFYVFAKKVLQTAPPPVLGAFPAADQEFEINGVIYFCVENDFQILRKYTDQGNSFASWFYRVAYRWLLSRLRRRNNINDKLIPLETDSEGLNLESVLPDPKHGADTQLEFNNLRAIVQEAIAQMDDDCQNLLGMAAKQMKPKEMAQIRKCPGETNKSISDNLRYCRKKLERILLASGLNIHELLNR